MLDFSSTVLPAPSPYNVVAAEELCEYIARQIRAMERRWQFCVIFVQGGHNTDTQGRHVNCIVTKEEPPAVYNSMPKNSHSSPGLITSHS